MTEVRQGLATLRRLACGLAVPAVLSLGLVAVTGSPPAAAATTARGEVTWAETPGASPNFIFPFVTAARFSAANVNELQRYLYRPLHWMGGPGSVAVNPKLSLAEPPVFSDGDRTVTITLKDYRWSNGERVVATDILFWMNLWKMKPTGYAGWFPGGLSMPTSVKSVTRRSPISVTIAFDRSFNPVWLLSNELSEITPLPMAWTTASASEPAGSAGCARAPYGTGTAACAPVYLYLTAQSGVSLATVQTPPAVKAPSTFAANPLWQVVDGPWELSSFGSTTPAVFKLNPAYSGPNKPMVEKFVEEPFTTGSEEFDALVAGTVDIGYLPPTDITAPARAAPPGGPVRPGTNNPRLGSYTLVPSYPWAINYFPYNFKSTGDGGAAGKIFAQLYVRQAMQHLVDQTVDIRQAYKGYAVATYGPVPALPKNPYASVAESNNPYPYSVAAARALLRTHGWDVRDGGTSVCERPGPGRARCGAGVALGAKLAFTLGYASGTAALAKVMRDLKETWSKAGVHVTLTSGWSAVLETVVPCSNGCPWELEDYASGWQFNPDVYPTGEQIFASGAPSKPRALHDSAQ